jgi:hypothetical protein
MVNPTPPSLQNFPSISSQLFLQVKRILLSTNSLFKSEDTALDLALAWTQQDPSNRTSIFPALLGKRTLLSTSSLIKTADTALDLALAWTQQDLSNRASIFPALLGNKLTASYSPRTQLWTSPWPGPSRTSVTGPPSSQLYSVIS